LIVDAEPGQILNFDPFLLDLLGFSREEYLGKKLWEVAAFQDSEASKSAFLELQQKARFDMTISRFTPRPEATLR
jgi:PAS domain-containing protein